MEAISFDLWGTLVKSNPEFGKAQALLVKEFTDIEQWQERKRVLKDYISTQEVKGIHVRREEAYKSIFKDFSLKDIENFINYSNELFLKHPPLIKHPETDVISILRDKGVRCYVSSNSTLIYGDILSKVVYDHFGIIRKNCRFSDELGVCKPNEMMFQFPVKPLYHVGDNILTDGASVNFGIKHYHINKQQNFNTFLDYARI